MEKVHFIVGTEGEVVSFPSDSPNVRFMKRAGYKTVEETDPELMKKIEINTIREKFNKAGAKRKVKLRK